ncbi:hypothetical protein [Cellvibrio sp. UBA7671]|uniref:hypothetical protein n=1 Tax=Cellvibrio sp. UBA7671 TaxID=1946312 RepID=UPI002F356F2A
MKNIRIFILFFLFPLLAKAERIELRIPPIAMYETLKKNDMKAYALPELEVFNADQISIYHSKIIPTNFKDGLAQALQKPTTGTRQLKTVLAAAVIPPNSAFSFDATKGYKYVFVQYWAENCWPCQDQMKEVETFIKENSQLKILWLLVERDPTQRDGLPMDDTQFQGPANEEKIR